MRLFLCGWYSFGNSVRVLHPMQDIFTAESGANILRQLTFEQQETNVVQVEFCFMMFCKSTVEIMTKTFLCFQIL